MKTLKTIFEAGYLLITVPTAVVIGIVLGIYYRRKQKKEEKK